MPTRVGGSALGAQQIHHAVERIAGGKVIIAVGSRIVSARINGGHPLHGFDPLGPQRLAVHPPVDQLGARVGGFAGRHESHLLILRQILVVDHLTRSGVRGVSRGVADRGIIVVGDRRSGAAGGHGHSAARPEPAIVRGGSGTEDAAHLRLDVVPGRAGPADDAVDDPVHKVGRGRPGADRRQAQRRVVELLLRRQGQHLGALGRHEVADVLARVVVAEGRAVVVEVGDLVRDDQGLAGHQRRLQGDAIGVGDQVPEVGVAPEGRGQPLQHGPRARYVRRGHGIALRRQPGGAGVVVLVGVRHRERRAEGAFAQGRGVSLGELLGIVGVVGGVVDLGLVQAGKGVDVPHPVAVEPVVPLFLTHQPADDLLAHQHLAQGVVGIAVGVAAGIVDRLRQAAVDVVGVDDLDRPPRAGRGVGDVVH